MCCAYAAMSLSLISAPISEPISLSICVGLSDLIVTPVISRQSLLRYCCVSSNDHSIRYSVLMFITRSHQLGMLLLKRICNLLVFFIKLNILTVGFLYGFNDANTLLQNKILRFLKSVASFSQSAMLELQIFLP